MTSDGRTPTVISYAQNQEDVVLHRLIQHVEKGTYIDVGAGHPVIENVTYSLYLKGWRGINIEPMSREAAMLRAVRPEDITFQIAAGAEEGEVTLHVAPFENRGASTLNRELADRYAAQGQEFTIEKVELRTVISIAREVGLGVVHVLKIDVETHEDEVLDGCSLNELRPWVIVIEATQPNSQVDSSISWEMKVLEAGYVVSLFDGLNKFYVRDDLPMIAKLLAAPANVLDDWVSWKLVETRRVLDESTESSRLYAESLLEGLNAAKQYVDRLEKLLYKSTGWIPDRARDQ